MSLTADSEPIVSSLRLPRESSSISGSLDGVSVAMVGGCRVPSQCEDGMETQGSGEMNTEALENPVLSIVLDTSLL